MCMSFRTYRRDVNPFETGTKGRLFVVGVSTNWPSKGNGQTKLLDSWKVTQLNLLRQKSVNEIREITIELYTFNEIREITI